MSLVATGRPSLADWRGVASASRVYAASGYEISDDLQRRRIEVLEKRYGGRARAHRAANIIQRAYRQYRMRNCWQQKTNSNIRNELPPIPSSNGTPGRSSLFKAPGSLTVSPHRYQPSTSLSAQLRASRAATEERTRTPPSPAPNGSVNRSMIDSLMSPRLGQRRWLPGGGEAPVVWVPRASLATQSAAHSNSLPRLERHMVRDESSTTRLPARVVSEQERKRQYRIALNFFNKKPERGVYLLTTWGFADETPESLAKLLFGRRGLSKQMIGEYVGTLHSPFHSCVLKYFIGLVDVRGLEVDVALRKAFQYFLLPKETEKIDRVLQAFSVHYCKCNPKRASMFRGGADSVHLLSFAIIMLNTDLHSPTLKNSARMRKEDFVKNLRGQDKATGEIKGVDFDRPILEGIYERVRIDEFVPGDDHVAQVRRVDNAIIGKDKPRLTETQRRLVCYCRLQQIVDPAKRQPSGAHERDVFLFNDMLVVAKLHKRRSGPSTTYSLKHYTPLLGASLQEFSRTYYEFGLTITCPNQEQLHFNARNAEDRRRFVADVVESMRESMQMEEVRLELEMDKLRAENQRDSGLPDLDPVPPFRRLSSNSLDSGVQFEETYEPN